VKRLKAFTLIELLVVIAIIALLISILLPSLSRARELSKRTVCSANIRGIGQAMYIYAQDDPQIFPAIAATTGQAPSNATEGAAKLFDPIDRINEPITVEAPSVSVDMWTVIRANNTTPKQFICPSTIDVPDFAQDTTVYYDFFQVGNVSYGYMYQHDPNRRVIGPASEPNFPVMADANPYVKGKVQSTLSPDRKSQWRGNSNNHTNREGQNVLFVDGHVSWEKGPDVGLSGKVESGLTSSRGRDNCYSTVSNVVAAVDAGSLKPELNINTDGSIQEGTVNLGSKSDACLVP